MNNAEKMSNCIFKPGRLALRYFEYVKTLLGSLSSQNIEIQQITSAKYTVLILHLSQNGRKKSNMWQQSCLVALLLFPIAS